MTQPISRVYQPRLALKYGCNPHQQPAGIYQLEGAGFPFEVLNGKPGYINLLDALNAWQLVKELDAALGLPAAASFKHVSPAGAAVAVPLSPLLRQVYGVSDAPVGELATAYLRARGADPMSSFGDFVALSRPVDLETAQVLKTLVSDGVIAPGFDPEALKLLASKKQGGYLVLQADPNYQPPAEELREVYGVGFQQRRNDLALNAEALLNRRVTSCQELTEAAVRDLLLAAIVIKYTQSNSVGYALDGQMIGIGAGQQSRVDCTKLAGRKAELWWLRQHPRVLSLPFKAGIKQVERINARVSYLEDDLTAPERKLWLENFTEAPVALSAAERLEWLGKLEGVALASDAFFPFRDNLDQASKRGVKFVVQAGGSNRDEEVIAAADEYGMVMAFSGIRLFHH